jgi:hypothetical protein
MAKLSESVMETGRSHIRAMDLDAFMRWVDATEVRIDKGVVRETMEKCFRYKDTEKALRMFEAGFANADPDEDKRNEKLGRRIGWGCLAIGALLLIGAIGGAVYLVSAIAGAL